MTQEEMEKLADMIAARLMDTFAARLDMIEEVVFTGGHASPVAGGSLTDSHVMGLEPNPDKQYVDWDSELAGYGVRVSPGGAKAFFVQGRIRGEKKETKISIGRFGQTLTAQSARLEAIRIIDLMRRGIDPKNYFDRGVF
jgi:hypothetical protein